MQSTCALPTLLKKFRRNFQMEYNTIHLAFLAHPRGRGTCYAIFEIRKKDLENQMLGAAVERRMLARRYRYLFWGGEYGKEIVLNSRMGIIRGGNGLTRDSGQEETSERREQSE